MAAAVVLTSAAAAQARPLVGFNDASYAHGAPVEQILDLHAYHGADVQRLNVPWRFVEREPGRYDWSLTDRSHDDGLARGIRTIALVTSAPPWAAPASSDPRCRGADTTQCQQPPARAHLPAFQRFLRTLVRRYPGLVAVEIYNEPNLATYNWQPSADPEYYTEVLRAAHDAVKAERRALPVISGGVTALPRNPPPGSMDHQDFLRRMYAAGAKDAMDGIGIHPYPGGREPSAAMALVQQVRALRNAAGDRSKPLWVTETGYTTAGENRVTPQRQAEALPQLVRLLAAEGDVEALVVHTLRDWTHPGYEDGFGILGKDRRPKPAAEPLRQAFLAIRRATGAAAARAARRSARRSERRTKDRRASAARERSGARTCRPPRRCEQLAVLR